MIKGMYSRMIQNLQLSGGSQYLQYIHDLLLYLDFGLVENFMHQMMGKLYKIVNLSKGYPDTPNWTESITGLYTYVFMQDMSQEIKELKQHGTWTIVSRKSVPGAQIFTST